MIYPIPQKNKLDGKPIKVESVKIIGDFTATAQRVCDAYGLPVGEGFELCIKTADSRRNLYIEELSRLCDEKYFITVNPERAVIEASCEKGVFRAVHTLCKLIEKNGLKTGELEDYPLFKERGYIEGYYGKTWETEKRLSVMRLMAKYGMNIFYYAPKDDIYHREKWREPYPEKELKDLAKLIDTASENQIDFVWCIGPGLSYKYTSEEDFSLLMKKMMSVYKLGVRHFSLLFDDIPREFRYSEDAERYDSIVDAHIHLVNRTYEAFKQVDAEISLSTCPTEYTGDGKGYYITKFGKNIPADVKIFWTGAEVCSRVLTSREANELYAQIGHKPLYWDNYPVNDCEMYQELHLGALIGRDKDLYKFSEGLVANTMEYAECSKLPLMTIADYLWNPQSYCPENSLENAYVELFGKDAERFKYFGDNLGVSCLSKYSGGIMSSTLAKARRLKEEGNMAGALAVLGEYNSKMRECLVMLEEKKHPLFSEAEKWVKKFSMCCDLLDAVYGEWAAPCPENYAKLKELTEKYNGDGTLLTGFSLRETAEKTLGLY